MINSVLTLSKSYFKHFAGFENQVWHGLFINFSESVLLGIFYFLPVYFIQGLDFTVINAGLTISFFGFGTILGGILGGLFSDSYSSDKVCFLSLICQAIVFLILVNLKSQWWICCDLFCMGFFSYTFITANHLWVLERAGSFKLKALNILNVISNLGLALSAIMMGFLFEYSFKVTFIICSLFLVLLAIYFSIVQFQINASKERAKPILDDDDVLVVKNTGLRLKILIVLICTAIIGFIIFQANTTYSQFLIDRFPALGFKSLSVLFTINCLMVVFFQSHFTHLFSQNNKLIVMGVGAFLVGFSMVILNFSYIFTVAVVACVIYTCGEMLFCPFSQIICYEAGSSGKKGGVMGVYRTIYATSRVSAPIVGTSIYQYFGSNVLWFFCGMLGIFSFLACFIFRRLESFSARVE